MKRANYIMSTVVCAVAVVFLILGRTYSKYSLDGYSSSASWPNILSWLLLWLGLLLAISNALSKNIPKSEIDFKSIEFQKVLIVMAAVIVLYVAFRYLGCLISLGIFFPLFMIFLGEHNWKTIVIYDVVSLVATYLIFELLLESALARPFFL